MSAIPIPHVTDVADGDTSRRSLHEGTNIIRYGCK
jgi:hypothetical protein